MENKKKLILISLYVLIGVVLIAAFISYFVIVHYPKGATPINTLPTITQNQSINVIASTLQSNQTNVPAGEFQFNVTLNIADNTNYSIQFTPSLPPNSSVQLMNLYPENQLNIKILGGFAPATAYKANLLRGTQVIYTWSFSTAAKKEEGSPLTEQQKNQSIDQQYYPLEKYIPYITNDFGLGYTGHLTLGVHITNPSANITTVEQEVDSWIESKGVDPATHTINYFDSNGNQIASQVATK